MTFTQNMTLLSKNRYLLTLLIYPLFYSNLINAQENSWGFKDTWYNVPGIFKAMNLLRDSHAAVIGLNDGYMTVKIGNALNKDGWLLAVDYDIKTLKNVANILQNNYPNVALVNADLLTLNLPDTTLDAIVMLKSYAKMSVNKSFLTQIKQSLKYEGRFVIVDEFSPAREHVPRSIQKKYDEITSNFVKDDLKSEGFNILEIQEPFVEVFPWSKKNWMIVAKKVKR